MAEKSKPDRTDTFNYSAGSYERLRSNEEELFELVKLSEVPIDKELFKVILELLKLNVAPTAILQVLKSLRPQGTPDDLGSHSPILTCSSGSSRHHTPPLSAESSVSHLPQASMISTKPLRTSGGELIKVEGGHMDPTQQQGRLKSEKASSNKQRSHDHKRKGKTSSVSSGGSRGSGKSRDTTGGSAKLKIRDYHSSVN